MRSNAIPLQSSIEQAALIGDQKVSHRPIQTEPVGVDSNSATPRCKVHDRFKVGFKVCKLLDSTDYWVSAR